MNIEATMPVTLQIDAFRLDIPLRYLDEPDCIAADFPGRNGARLRLTIGMDDGIVRDWPKGRVESVHEKVCDEGTYTLINAKGATLAEDSEGYVPGFMPGDHYGDYVILDIDGNGRVHGWNPKPRDVAEWVESRND